MQINTDGLVIRESSVGENDRLITVLTREEGLVRAFARQAKSMKNSKASSTQLLCYSRFSIYQGRDKYMINDAQPLAVFFDLRKDLGRLSLAQYFCELAGALAPEESPAGDFLRLILNALHFLSKGLRPNLLLKAIVEMRMLSLAGYMPDLVSCAECGCYEAEEMRFLPQSGILYCQECWDKLDPSLRDQPSLPMGKGTLTAFRHTIYAEFDKLFSFQLPEAALVRLAQISETYLLQTLGRGFRTLDFYHQMEGL
ncbi:MAG: DNA repair protein RecO [Clostridiales bacterium]|jgi:DNA repair protein RecO (recombination protein O)|nr:DNA repair protein RecO [Clostridiales bacterium]